MESIKRGWELQGRRNNQDFASKISNFRHEIARWRKNNPPFGREKIAELQKALEEVQGDDSRTQEDILDVSRKLHDAYRDEEDYWQQKSRNMWHTVGDTNSTFFHALTKQRRSKNIIIGLHNAGGQWITEEKEIEKVAVDYFQDLFLSTVPTDFENFLSEIPVSITEQMNNRLTALATEEEVRRALFMMHPEKAPGPDGMTALFFQHAWHIIKGDVLEFVNTFLRTGKLDTRLNMTNICLIPKTERPTRMT